MVPLASKCDVQGLSSNPHFQRVLVSDGQKWTATVSRAGNSCGERAAEVIEVEASYSDDEAPLVFFSGVPRVWGAPCKLKNEGGFSSGGSIENPPEGWDSSPVRIAIFFFSGRDWNPIPRNSRPHSRTYSRNNPDSLVKDQPVSRRARLDPIVHIIQVVCSRSPERGNCRFAGGAVRLQAFLGGVWRLPLTGDFP